MRTNLPLLALALAAVACTTSPAAAPTTPPHPLGILVPFGAPTRTPFLPAPITGTPPPTSIPPPPTTVPSPTSLAASGNPVPASPPLSGGETVNFLLTGSDSRGGPSFRTDTLIIVSLRPADRLVTLISIPRDLYVFIPGWTMQRINTAYLHGELSGYPGGGPALLKDTIRHNLGISIDHMASVDFDGFRQIVNTLGGIDLPLACPFTDWDVIDPLGDLEDVNNWYLRTIGPGVIHMDGDLALWYARARLRSSDFDRGRRQQEVLRAIYAKALTLDILPQIPRLYTQFRDTVTTDLTLDDLLALVPFALDLNAARIRSYYLNKDVVQSWTTPGGGSVLLPVGPAMEARIREAMGPPGPEEDEHLETTVEIWNWTAIPGLETLAAERLHYAGFQTLLAPPAGQNAAETLLYDLTPEGNPENAAVVLALLGLRLASLRHAPTPGSPAAFRLALGADYNPCFDPARIER